MSWLLFVSIFIMAIFLYLPGMLLIRCFRLPWFSCAVFAPPCTLAIYGVLEIVYAFVGINSSWLTVFLPTTVLLLILNLFLVRLSTISVDLLQDNFLTSFSSKLKYRIPIIFPYILAGIIITSFVFLRNFGDTNSYTQLYDNAWHMGIIRKFLETGDYSTLTAGNIVDTVGSTFYPTGWHSLVALTASATGMSVPASINASIFLIVAVVYPMSMYVLFRVLFGKRKLLLTVGAFSPLLFAAFPWRFLTFGPLYSNLLSFGVLPLVIAMGLLMLQATSTARKRFLFFTLWIISSIGIAVTQPNAVFTMGLLITPYIFTQVPQYISNFQHNVKHLVALTTVISSILISAIIAIWYFLYHADFMQRTVTWQWPAFESKAQAFYDVLFVGFHLAEPQILLGILIIIGIIYTVFRRRLFWISISYLIFCFLYALSSSTDGKLKAVLTGFWYHDSYRLGASAVFFGAALAAVGIFVIIRVIIYVSNSICRFNIANQRILISIFLATILIINFFPSHSIPGRGDVTTAFGAITRDIKYWNAPETEKSYTAAESSFVHKVMQTIPENSLVINQPWDGSAYAWGADSLNVYYKAWDGNWMGSPSEDNILIGSKLNEYYYNEQVQTAVKNIDAHYVLLLDRSDFSVNQDDPSKMTSTYGSYAIEMFNGLDSINNETPGFTLLLEQGNMRLYKIDPII